MRIIVLSINTHLKNNIMQSLNLKNFAIATLATIVILTFTVFAVVHIVNLTQAGLINWKY